GRPLGVALLAQCPRPAQRAAAEDRLQQRGAEAGGQPGRAQPGQGGILQAGRGAQGDAGEQRGACHADVGVGGAQLGFRATQIGTAQQQFGRQAGGNRIRQRQVVQRCGLDTGGNALRGLAQQQRQRGFGGGDLLTQSRQGRTTLLDQ